MPAFVTPAEARNRNVEESSPGTRERAALAAARAINAEAWEIKQPKQWQTRARGSSPGRAPRDDRDQARDRRGRCPPRRYGPFGEVQERAARALRRTSPEFLANPRPA